MDLFKLLLSAATLNLVGIIWVVRPRQTLVPQSISFCAAMSLKVWLVCCCLFALLYGLLGVSADTILYSVPFVSALCAVANLENVPFESPITAAIILTILLPFYIAKQYVLGFPDRDELLLSPTPTPEIETADARYGNISGRTGIVVATLRPVGRVVVEGSEFDARTDGGDYIDVDSQVIVRRLDRETLIVEGPITYKGLDSAVTEARGEAARAVF